MVVPQTRESFLAGLELYRARTDKGYSLVDCISMQTMRQKGLTEVLTNDRHFEQEGFRALFRNAWELSASHATPKPPVYPAAHYSASPVQLC